MISKKVLLHGFAIIILSLGVALSISSTLGASAFDAMNVFLGNLFNHVFKTNFFTPGVWIMINSLIIATTIYLLERKKSIFLSLAMAFIIGLLLDVFLDAIQVIMGSHLSLLWIRILFAVLGLAIMALGTFIMTTTHMPTSPLDALMVFIKKKAGTLLKAKVIVEVSFLILSITIGFITEKTIVGYSLWHQISYFTIVYTVAVGPLIGLYERLWYKKKGDKHGTKQDDRSHEVGCQCH